MKHEKLEILDIEDDKDDDRFDVIFEVPGDKYNQNYPKRLKHGFPKKERFFEETEDGQKRFEKIIRDTYLETDEDKQERKKADRKIPDIKDSFQGRELKK